jgi:hypothetical protein
LSQQLIISAGMPRAGSGWYYNLIHDLVVLNGGQDARQIRKTYHLESFLSEVNCNISTLRFHKIVPVFVPAIIGNQFVIKTHAGPTQFVRYLIKQKQILIIYIYRDPRAAMLSAYEYGQKAIQNNRPNAFSHLNNLEEAAEFIKFYIDVWHSWSKLEQVLKVRYEDLLSDYRQEVDKAAEFLKLDLDCPECENVIKKYQPGMGDPGQVGTHFSKGEAERFRRKLTPEQLSHYSRMFETSLAEMGYEK